MENLNANPAEEKDLGPRIVQALIQFLYMLAFILFLCPFNFWKKSVLRLEEARAKGAWDFAASGSRWPFLSFIKAIMLNFVFDGLIFISYFLGVISAIIALFKVGFGAAIMALISAYYAPMFISPARDLFVILIMPFSKFLSWCSRPAQYLEIDMNKKEK